MSGTDLGVSASVGGRPVWGTNQHDDYFAPGGQFGFDERIGHVGRLPVVDAARLDHVPSKGDPGETGSGLGGSRRIHVSVDDPKAGVGWGCLSDAHRRTRHRKTNEDENKQR
jgi:hypothetical protein